MTKFRSRRIVEATQWFPGTKIDGVVQIDADTAIVDNRAFSKSEASLMTFEYSEKFYQIKPGQYVVKQGNGSRCVMSEAAFIANYENIGG